MCLAVPGKIIAITNDTATIEYTSETRKARLIEKKYKLGDYVLVQGGIVLQKVSKKEAEESLKLWSKAR